MPRAELLERLRSASVERPSRRLVWAQRVAAGLVGFLGVLGLARLREAARTHDPLPAFSDHAGRLLSAEGRLPEHELLARLTDPRFDEDEDGR